MLNLLIGPVSRAVARSGCPDFLTRQAVDKNLPRSFSRPIYTPRLGCRWALCSGPGGKSCTLEQPSGLEETQASLWPARPEAEHTRTFCFPCSPARCEDSACGPRVTFGRRSASMPTDSKRSQSGNAVSRNVSAGAPAVDMHYVDRHGDQEGRDHPASANMLAKRAPTREGVSRFFCGPPWTD